MRLIDADELKKHKVHSKEFAENVVSVAQIDWQPTIEAVPIVRCGECKWANSRGECAYNGKEAEDIKMGYCNYGAPKDEVKNDKARSDTNTR